MSRTFNPLASGGAGSATPTPTETQQQGFITDSVEIRQDQPFPLHCLPPEAEAMARAIAETERTPESLAGSCVLGFLSTAIGAGLEVKSAPNRTTRGNLYLLVSAESGSGKSETFRHAARPFQDYEAALLESWRANILPGLNAERDILEVEVAKLRKQIGGADGHARRDEIKEAMKEKKAALASLEVQLCSPVLSCEDVTVEKLALQLSAPGETLTSLSSDAGSIVNNLLGRYNPGGRTDEGLYLKAWTGEKCRVDRVGRPSIVLNRPCLSAIWLTQPDKIETLLAERSLTDGGLIPRLLVCHTNAEPKPIEGHSRYIPTETSEAYGSMIRTLLESYRLSETPRIINPTPEAVDAMNQHYNGIVARWRSELRDIASFSMRWTEQAWRIAVCVHAGMHGQQAHDVALELETAQRAITIADWFAGQQLEILSVGRQKARREQRDKLLGLLAERPEGITVRDAQLARIGRDAESCKVLLEELVEAGRLVAEETKPEGGGWTKRIYRLAGD